LLGLWRAEPWGWWLAVLADGVLCAQDLWFLLDYGSYAARHPRMLVFDALDFAALTVLLYRPVKNHFLRRNGVQRQVTTTPRRVQTSRVRPALKPQRILIYFAAAIIATCVATAFSLALWMGQKNGGSRGFVLFLYYGFLIGAPPRFFSLSSSPWWFASLGRRGYGSGYSWAECSPQV
jgi:hypothetical protein